MTTSFSTSDEMDAIKKYIESRIEFSKEKHGVSCGTSTLVVDVSHLWATLNENAEIVDTDFLDRMIESVVKVQKIIETFDPLDSTLNDESLAWDSIMKIYGESIMVKKDIMEMYDPSDSDVN